MDSEDEGGLESRLPWGRSSPPQPTRSPPRAAGADAADSPGRTNGEVLGSADSVGLTVAAGPSAVMIGNALEGLHFGILTRLELLEERAEARAAAAEARADARVAQSDDRAQARVKDLEVRLQELERRFEAAQAATVVAMTRLAEQAGTRFEEQAAQVDAALLERHVQFGAKLSERQSELEASLDRAQTVALEIARDLPSLELVNKIVEDAAATGEVLYAELLDLRRLLVDHLERSGGPVSD